MFEDTTKAFESKHKNANNHFKTYCQLNYSNHLSQRRMSSMQMPRHNHDMSNDSDTVWQSARQPQIVPPTINYSFSNDAVKRPSRDFHNNQSTPNRNSYYYDEIDDNYECNYDNADFSDNQMAGSWRNKSIAYCLSCLDVLCIWECCGFWLDLQRCISLIIFDPFAELFVLLCILINTLFMALDTDDTETELKRIFERGNYFFTATFAVEAAMKILALSPKFYFREGWNVFDSIVVALSMLELSLEGYYGLSVLRSFRLLRVFKLARTWPMLNNLLTITGKAMGDLSNLTFVLSIIVFIFAVMGMQLFGSKYVASSFPDQQLPRWNFTDFMHSFMIVFRILCAEWIEPMWDCLLVGGWPCIPFFLIAVTVGNLVVLNLFLALLLASFGASNLSSPQTDSVDTKKLQIAIARFSRFARWTRSLLSALVEFFLIKLHFKSAKKKKATMKKRLKKPKKNRKQLPANEFALKDQQNASQLRRDVEKSESSSLCQQSNKQRKVAGDSYSGSIGGDSNRAEIRVQIPIIVQSNTNSSANVSPSSQQLSPLFRFTHCGKQADKRLDLCQDKVFNECNDDDEEHIQEWTAMLQANQRRDSTLSNKSAQTATQACACKPSAEKMSVDGPEADVQDSCTSVKLAVDLEAQQSKAQVSGCLCLVVRKFARRIVEHKYFEQATLVLIIVSSASLAFEDKNLGERPTLRKTLDVLDTIFTLIFSLEMLLKCTAFGLRRYFGNIWSWLDFVIVLVSFVNLMASIFGSGKIQALKTMRTLRAMRGLRPLRALQRFQGMRVVVNALIQAIPGIFNVLLVILVFWLIFSIMGVQMFGGKFWRCLSPEDRTAPVDFMIAANKRECIERNLTWANTQINFDNVLNGYLALFQVATFEGWIDIMNSAVDSRMRDDQPIREINIYMYFYFVFFIIFGSFFTLNLFIGVIIDNFNEQKKKTGGSLEIFMTDEQKKYYHAIKKMKGRKPVKAITRPRLKLQAYVFDLTTSKKFDMLIMIIIGLNMLVMSLEHYGEPPEFSAVSSWQTSRTCTKFVGDYSNSLYVCLQLRRRKDARKPQLAVHCHFHA